ncbi:MAG: polysaccharide pyruvyl transferase family protein [Thermodesulfobacteriota bacterium]
MDRGSRNNILERVARCAPMVKYLNPFSVKVGYWGWLGRGNLGDEALFHIICKLLEPVQLLEYQSFYRKGKFLERFQGKKLSGMMMGAGTLINSKGIYTVMNEYAKRGLPCFAFGAGVLDPDFYCNYEGYDDSLDDWVELLSRFKVVTVRGYHSANILKKHGCESVRVVGDPVLSFAPDILPEKTIRRIIGINFGNTKNNSCLWGNSDSDVFDFVKDLARHLLSLGFAVRFFSIWVNDDHLVRKVAREIGGEITTYCFSQNMAQYMEAVNNVDILIGEKLHSVIGALSSYVPSIMLAYQPKCIDFMNSVSLDKYVVKTDELEVGCIEAMISEILDDYDNYRERIFKNISYWKCEQRKVADEIIATFN